VSESARGTGSPVPVHWKIPVRLTPLRARSALKTTLSPLPSAETDGGLRVSSRVSAKPLKIA
jgi:hypothetical protein